MNKKERSPRNKTLELSSKDRAELVPNLIKLDSPKEIAELKNKVVNQNFFDAIEYIPSNTVDLLVMDPPYNLTKTYNQKKFKKKPSKEYQKWFSDVIQSITRTLKQNASVYICSDWQTSIIIAPILDEFFTIRNRITWEREKGRGAKANWKNSTEDIWFCTKGNDYTFNVESVKLKKKVIAPYRDADGNAKDWEDTPDGRFRLTYPSNIWTDITIPYWSMPENTDHPTQKPEKLIAKLVLASSNPGDLVFDPFLGSGTTAVVCKKLDRNFLAIEMDQEYSLWSEKRLKIANANPEIQGYHNDIFWERNSLSLQKKS